MVTCRQTDRKEMKMKKIVALFLILLILPLAHIAFADDAQEYTYNYDWLYVTGYKGAGGDIILPATMASPKKPENEYRALAVAQGAFKDNQSLTGVTIPENYQAIHEDAFSNCKNLEQLNLPDGLVIIDDRAFLGCSSLIEITLPVGISFIGNSAFGETTNLKAVHFRGPAPRMEKNAFGEGTAHLTFYVPDDQIDAYQTELAYAMGNDTAVNIVSSGQNVQLFDHSTILGQGLLLSTADISPEQMFDFDAKSGTVKSYKGFCTRVDIPASIDGVPVTAIGYRAFRENGYLSYVTFPQGVTLIGQAAFENVKRLYWAELPETVTQIGEGAFYGYAGERLALNEGLESIDNRAFGFTAKRLTDVRFPNTLLTIGDEAFFSSGIRHLQLNEGLVSIGAKAFASSPLEDTLTLPQSLESIGEMAFSGTDIAKAVLPMNLHKVGDKAFSNCKKLKKLVLTGYTLPEFGTKVFENITAFSGKGYGEQLGAKVTLPADATQEQIDTVQIAFEGMGLKVNAQLAEAQGMAALEKGTYEVGFYKEYRLLANYTGDASDIIAPEKYGDFYLDGVNAKTFKDNQNLTSFAVSHNGKYVYIGEEAFSGSSLETIDLYNSVHTIDDGAFENTQLTKADLSHVTHIGARAFKNTPLKEVVLGDEVTFIGDNAFADTALESFVIPANAQMNASALSGIPLENIRISDNATDEQIAHWSELLGFPWYNPLVRAGEESVYLSMPYTGNESDFVIDPQTGVLTAYVGNDVDVVIPRSIDGVTVRTIGYSAFDLARDYTDSGFIGDIPETWLPLRSVIIPETVTAIEDGAFAYCQQLETVISYAPLLSTGRQTFQYCRNLKDVVFVNAIQMLDNYVFEGCEALKNVYYRGTLDAIGENTFAFSGIERFIADAKVIKDSAFRNCESLTDIHIRNSVDQMEMNVFYGCSLLINICMEVTDATVFSSGDTFSGECAEGAVLILPLNISDDQAEEIYDKWSTFNLGPIATKEHVLRADCAQLENDIMPDVNALLANMGEAPEQKTARTLEPRAGTWVDEAGDASGYMGVWHLSDLVLDGEPYTAADLELAMVMNFFDDRTALGIIKDEETEMTWRLENGYLIATDEYDEMIFSLNAGGDLVAEQDDVVMLFTREGEVSGPTQLPAANENAVLDDFKGIWVLERAGVGSLTLSAEMLEMGMTFTVYGDTATIDVDGEILDVESWMEGFELSVDDVLEGRFRLHKDGTLSIDGGDMILWLVRTGDAPEPNTTAKATDEPKSGEPTTGVPMGGDFDVTGSVWVCTKAEVDGYEIDVKMLGRYDVVFHEDGTAQMNIGGVPMPNMSWVDEGDHINADYYGVPFIFERIDDDKLQLDYYETMLLTYEHES